MTRIVVLSDLHNELLRYEMPKDLNFDVLVAAGDIDDRPEEAVDFLKSIGKPVVWVAGNHDLWSKVKKSGLPYVDFHARLNHIRNLVKGTNIHFLEQSSVVIDDTRFLGNTFWTDFFGGSEKMLHYVRSCMNDYGYIGAQEWLADPDTRAEFLRECKYYGFEIDEDKVEWKLFRFHPILALLWHRSAKNWLDDELKIKGPWKHNVVVTHHAPTYLSLTTTGYVKEKSLDPRTWPDRLDVRWDNDNIYKIGAYASDCSKFLYDHREHISLWVHGHIHDSVDVAASGVRVVSNPRGYAYHKEDTQSGNNRNFDARFVIDLDSQAGYMDPLQKEINEAVIQLETVFKEMSDLGAFVRNPDPIIKQSILESLQTRQDRFHEIGSKISERVSSNFEYRNTGGALHFPAININASSYLPSIGYKSTRGRVTTLKSILAQFQKFIETLRKVPTFPARIAKARVAVIRLLLAEHAKFGVQTVAAERQPWQSDNDLLFDVPAPHEAPFSELRDLSSNILKEHKMAWRWRVQFHAQKENIEDAPEIEDATLEAATGGSGDGVEGHVSVADTSSELSAPIKEYEIVFRNEGFSLAANTEIIYTISEDQRYVLARMEYRENTDPVFSHAHLVSFCESILEKHGIDLVQVDRRDFADHVKRPDTELILTVGDAKYRVKVIRKPDGNAIVEMVPTKLTEWGRWV